MHEAGANRTKALDRSFRVQYMSIYVESLIRGSIDEVWRLTQTPELHAQWDMRFTEIEYLPRPDEDQPQKFHYATRIGFGMAIEGEGESVGSRDGINGERTERLEVLVRRPQIAHSTGAGYWRYIPTEHGVRFLTSYDYRVRHGFFGRLFDRFVFRPLLGWATAWSFDRLRLWIEQGISPAVSLERSLIHAIARLAIAIAWIYQAQSRS